MPSESEIAKLTATMEVLVEQVRELRGDFREVHDRLVRLEAQNMLTEMQSLENRLLALETDMHRRGGALRLGESIPKYIGWFVASVMAAVAALPYMKGN